MKKLVVVTGASSGIGLELARRFSEQGHPVLMLARRNDLMEKMELPNTICRSWMLLILMEWHPQLEMLKPFMGK